MTTVNKETDEYIGVCFPEGFRASGVSCGIKKTNVLDLAIISSDYEGISAATFTSNRVKAAPVLISKEHVKNLKTNSIIISSGNANAATGQDGINIANKMCQTLAKLKSTKKENILIAQTGLIGIPLPKEEAINGVISAYNSLSRENGLLAAKAIMTTDTKEKISQETIETDEGEIKIGAIAKGAAMLAPSMATMIACITTDALITKTLLNKVIKESIKESFNSIVVDNNMSTNDTVFLLANGASNTPIIENELDPRFKIFMSKIKKVCKSLALQMIKDAEGATKLLIMKVIGAKSKEDAYKASYAVSSSLLVKCSLSGKEAYWGRVIADLGASGADFDPNKVDIFYGEELVCKNGFLNPHDSNYISNYIKNETISITANLNNGNFEATTYGCDLTHQYVTENMGLS